MIWVCLCVCVCVCVCTWLHTGMNVYVCLCMHQPYVCVIDMNMLLYISSQRTAPDVAGIYAVVFSYVDGVKYNLQSQQVN